MTLTRDERDPIDVQADTAAVVVIVAARIDESVPGDGIGLAVVRRMVEETWGGRIDPERGDLGGLRVRTTFPPASAGPTRR